MSDDTPEATLTDDELTQCVLTLLKQAMERGATQLIKLEAARLALCYLRNDGLIEAVQISPR